MRFWASFPLAGGEHSGGPPADSSPEQPAVPPANTGRMAATGSPHDPR